MRQTFLEGGAAAKNAPNGFKKAESEDSNAGFRRGELGHFWSKNSDFLHEYPPCIWLYEKVPLGSWEIFWTPNIPNFSLFWAIFGVPEADYHSPNLPMVIYHANGVRHIRWNISRNPSYGFIGVRTHIGGLWLDRLLIEKRLWGPKGPKVFFRRTCSLVRATNFFRGGGGREKRPDRCSKDFFIR